MKTVTLCFLFALVAKCGNLFGEPIALTNGCLSISFPEYPVFRDEIGLSFSVTFTNLFPHPIPIVSSNHYFQRNQLSFEYGFSKRIAGEEMPVPRTIPWGMLTNNVNLIWLQPDETYTWNLDGTYIDLGFCGRSGTTNVVARLRVREDTYVVSSPEAFHVINRDIDRNDVAYTTQYAIPNIGVVPLVVHKVDVLGTNYLFVGESGVRLCEMSISETPTFSMSTNILEISFSPSNRKVTLDVKTGVIK